MNTKDYLADFYENRCDEDSRLTSRHGRVEYLTTMRYIEKYLRRGMRVIEIGAGTGRYSHALAKRGYSVDAVELLEHNIAVFNDNRAEGENITINQADATDLSTFESEGYDITLLLGPMYHLYTKEDKLKALSEAVRVTKKGGVVFAAYCMGDASIMSYGFVRGEIFNIIDSCLLDTETFETFSNPWDIFELYRKEDIEELRNTFNVTPLHLVATDGYACHMRQRLAEMDDAMYEMFLKYHFATCERQDLIGYSNHTLDIFRKD